MNVAEEYIKIELFLSFLLDLCKKRDATVKRRVESLRLNPILLFLLDVLLCSG